MFGLRLSDCGGRTVVIELRWLDFDDRTAGSD